MFQASEVRAAWSRGHNALRCGAAGGVSLGPKGGYFYTLQREGGVWKVLEKWVRSRPIRSQSQWGKRGELVGSILTWISEVVNQGGGTGYIPTDIAGNTDSRYGAICGQKR